MWDTDIVINCSFCRKFRLYYVFKAVKIADSSKPANFVSTSGEFQNFFSPSDGSTQTLHYPEQLKIVTPKGKLRYPRLEA